jgi:4-amino-4-deoxy-L-arabinose transferase-like glycosyltransferase
MRYNPAMRSKLWVVLFFAALIFILFTPIKSFFNFYDEGFAVFNATRLLNHEAPYRDFWAIYPPGQLYILAGLFKLFGVSLYTSRVYDTIVRAILVLGFFLVARKITPRKVAYLATLAIALVLASQSFYSYAVYPALAVSIYAFYCALEYVARSSTRWLVASGVIGGLACLIRWDIGLYIGLGISAALFIRQLSNSLRAPAPRFQSVFTAIRVAVMPLAFTLAILVIGYGLVSIRSGLGNVWDQIFYFPAVKLRAVRWLAYPKLLYPHINDVANFWNIYARPMDWLRFYLPLLIYAITWIYYAYAILVRKIVLEVQHFGILAAALCGPFLFSQALSRYDYIHVLPSLIAAALVVAALFPRILSGSERWLVKSGIILLLPAVASVYLLAPFNAVLGNLDDYPLEKCRTQLVRASCTVVNPNEEKTVLYIQAHTQPNEPIFVGNQRHDILFVNDVGFYFLAARPSATRYSELHPGVANTLPVQQEIANELETKQVHLLVLVNIWLSNEPNGSSKSTGVRYLDDYIHGHYFLIASYGEYQVWERNR